jgi:hypothetical protein
VSLTQVEHLLATQSDPSIEFAGTTRYAEIGDFWAPRSMILAWCATRGLKTPPALLVAPKIIDHGSVPPPQGGLEENAPESEHKTTRRRSAASKTDAVMNAVKAVVGKHGRPPKSMSWKDFNGLVWKKGGVEPDAKLWDERTIRRRVEVLSRSEVTTKTNGM